MISQWEVAFEHRARLFPDNETATDASSMVTDDKTSMIYSRGKTVLTALDIDG